MSLYLLKRTASFLLTLLAASVVVFAVLALLPGTVADVMLGESATAESRAALTAKLGLDAPAPTRYGRWVLGLLHGDMGQSVSYEAPVAGLIAERLQVTAPLAAMAMALATVLALALGLYAASRHNQTGDVSVMALSQLGIAVPNFWFGVLLVLVFSVKLQWFSAGGFPGWHDEDGGGAWPAVKALILPAVALAVVQAAILARITRSAVLDVLREDFVRTARAKGMPESQVRWRHVLRNALIPVVTIIGLQLPRLVGGAAVTETIFSWPGMGRLGVEAALSRDYPLIMAITLFVAVAVVAFNLIVDLIYPLLDPRIQLE